MRLEAIPVGNDPPHEVNVVIEVPIGGEPIKYEMDKEAGALIVDRFLYTAMRYPGNYGFIPHTLSADGDPCDVIIANTRAIIPGAVMSCRVVGVLLMEDEAGGDEKIIAVPSTKLTRRYEKVQNYSDLPSITLEQIEHFFSHYKGLGRRSARPTAGRRINSARQSQIDSIFTSEQKHSLLTKKIPEPPGRSHPDRPSRLIKGDRLLDMRAKGFREIDKVPDRAEMNVLRFIPLTRKPSGHGHPTEE
jgi:inorganic pyrophosphatase